MKTLSGGVYDPERAAAAMVRRHGVLGTFAVDHVLGNLWSRPQLSRRDRSLIVVTFLATIGSTEELRQHVLGAVNHGLSRDEVEEVVLHVAGYAGFPMAMQATRVVDSVWREIDGVEKLPPREEGVLKDDPQRWTDATDVLSTLFAGRAASDPEEARAGIVERLGGVGEMAFDYGFGELWSRDQLSRRDRSMVTVAILAILTREAELAVHVPAAFEPRLHARGGRGDHGAAHRLRRVPAGGGGHHGGACRVRQDRRQGGPLRPPHRTRRVRVVPTPSPG